MPARYVTLRTVDGVSSRLRAADVRPLPTPTADAELADVDTVTDAPSRAEASSLRAYVQQVEQLPWLTRVAQNELVAAYQHAQRVQAWLDADEVPSTQQRQAQRTVRDGDQKLATLVTSNFRIIQQIAREQAVAKLGHERAMEMLPDLVNEGSLALTDAAQRYDSAQDPRDEPSFFSYAASRVRDAIRTAAGAGQMIQLPSSWERLRKIAFARQQELARQNGRQPTDDELRDAVYDYCYTYTENRLPEHERSLPDDERRELVHAKLVRGGLVRRINDISETLALSQQTTSLDLPVGEDGDSTLGELQADPSAEEPFEQVEHAERADAIRSALANLPEREQRILLLRFGFVDGEQWKYADIAEEFGVTAERIRQIQTAALERLRQPHTQYAHLAAHLPGQYDDGPPADAETAVRRHHPERPS